MLLNFFPAFLQSASAASAVVAWDQLFTEGTIALTNGKQTATATGATSGKSSTLNLGDGTTRRYIELVITSIQSGGGSYPIMGATNVHSSTFYNGVVGVANASFGVSYNGNVSGPSGVTNDYVNGAMTLTTGDTFMMCIDMTLGYAWVGKNGVWATNSGGVGNPQLGSNPSFTGLTGTWYPGASYTNATTEPSVTVNGTGMNWIYDAPVGFIGYDGSQHAKAGVFFNTLTTNTALALTNLQTSLAQVGGTHEPSITNNGVSTGKRYIEYEMGTFSGAGDNWFGAANSNSSGIWAVNGSNLGSNGFGGISSFAYSSTNNAGVQGVTGDTGSFLGTLSSGDIVMMAIDFGLGFAWFGKNGTWITNLSGVGDPIGGVNPSISSISGTWWPAVTVYNTSSVTLQGSAPSWSFTRPTGYVGFDGS